MAITNQYNFDLILIFPSGKTLAYRNPYLPYSIDMVATLSYLKQEWTKRMYQRAVCLEYSINIKQKRNYFIQNIRTKWHGYKIKSDISRLVIYANVLLHYVKQNYDNSWSNWTCAKQASTFWIPIVCTKQRLVFWILIFKHLSPKWLNEFAM